MKKYDAVLFDLLTALLDSWTLWDSVAGSRDAGRTWRAAYLKLTYGCGAYRPYETLVREAAAETGLGVAKADELAARWDELQPWDDAAGFLSRIDVPMGVVTNCSEALGRRAAARVGVPFKVLVTSERAGFYKPDPRPYRLALAELALPPERVLFVAGSAFDLVGTSAVGLRTLWHNRAGLARPPQAPPPAAERSTLRELLPFLEAA
ncbi:MAG TPA: HAD-IA family hydrolase [Burkholderiales bacterium]|nr:HAD-IA family hydrolase [Burkholderiales bacterium]